MANHVHALLQPKPSPNPAESPEVTYIPLKDITKRLKGYTALEANRLLNRTVTPSGSKSPLIIGRETRRSFTGS
jgi:hypothetical protein